MALPGSAAGVQFQAADEVREQPYFITEYRPPTCVDRALLLNDCAPVEVFTNGDDNILPHDNSVRTEMMDIEGYTVVPEPATFALVGLVALRLTRRRGRRSSGRLTVYR